MNLSKDFLKNFPGIEQVNEKLALMKENGFSQRVINAELDKFLLKQFEKLSPRQIAEMKNPGKKILEYKSLPENIKKDFLKKYLDEELNNGVFIKVTVKKYLFYMDHETKKRKEKDLTNGST